jgi:peptidyl-tRNA hydrolase
MASKINVTEAEHLMLLLVPQRWLNISDKICTKILDFYYIHLCT